MPDATTLQMIDPSGTVVKSYPVANMSVEGYIPITDMYQDGWIKNGLWSFKMADDSTVGYMWAIISGASISWDKSTYSPYDTATISWTITDSAWNVTSPGEHFFFNLKIIDAFGNQKYSQSITTQTGSYSFQWTSTDTPGAYYAEITRTNSLAPIITSVLNLDYTTLIESFGFVGHVYDGETTLPISGANVIFNQLGVPETAITGLAGNYTTGTIYLTGATVNIGCNVSGYRSFTYSLMPTTSRTITRDIVLTPLNASHVGLSIGGPISDSTYGNPVASATVTATNGSESHSVVANNRSYYLFDDLHGGPLTNGVCYHMNASRTGFNFLAPTEVQCVVG